MTKDEISEQVKSFGFWYHMYELPEGVQIETIFTHSVPATRAILKKIEVKGKDVLDIGTMDGLFAVLAERRGAGRVVATDRPDNSKKIKFLQKMLSAKFDYVSGITLPKNAETIRKRWGSLSDLTIFSGVLYHTFDPMGSLAQVRGTVKQDGLVIIETVAVIADTAKLLYNDNFWLYSPGTYFVPSTGWLRSVLPFVGLMPIDVKYFEFGERHGERLCRIAVCCRAVDIPVFADPAPNYASGAFAWFRNYARGDFDEVCDVDAIMGGSARADIGYGETISDPLNLGSFYGKPQCLADPENYRLKLADLE